MKWTRLLLTVLTLGVAAAGSLAADPLSQEALKAVMEAERQALIAKYDKDGDGALNEKERAAMQVELGALRLAQQAAKFAALDVDASGGLTLTEFAAGAPANASAERIQAAFTRLDTDGNGVISVSEFTAKPSLGEKKPPTPPAKAHEGGSGGGRRGASVAMIR